MTKNNGHELKSQKKIDDMMTDFCEMAIKLGFFSENIHYGFVARY